MHQLSFQVVYTQFVDGGFGTRYVEFTALGKGIGASQNTYADRSIFGVIRSRIVVEDYGDFQPGIIEDQTDSAFNDVAGGYQISNAKDY